MTMHSPRPVLVIGGHERRFAPGLESCRCCRVHDGAAGEGQSPKPLRVECDRQLLPMHQIGADGVAPMHVAPVPAVGIMLIVEVILTVIEDQPVGVIIPAALRREVELRAQRLVVKLPRPFD